MGISISDLDRGIETNILLKQFASYRFDSFFEPHGHASILPVSDPGSKLFDGILPYDQLDSKTAKHISS